MHTSKNMKNWHTCAWWSFNVFLRSSSSQSFQLFYTCVRVARQVSSKERLLPSSLFTSRLEAIALTLEAIASWEGDQKRPGASSSGRIRRLEVIPTALLKPCVGIDRRIASGPRQGLGRVGHRRVHRGHKGRSVGEEVVGPKKP